jgi:hypothetical protein
LLLARIEPEEPGFDNPEIAAAEPAEKHTNLQWDRLSWRPPFLRQQVLVFS